MFIGIRLLIVVVLVTGSACAAPPALRFKPITFTSAAGKAVEAEEGELRVPERRGVAKSGTVTLKFVRFKSTSPRPGPPIVYLAGGPGSSGIQTAKEARFPLLWPCGSTATSSRSISAAPARRGRTSIATSRSPLLSTSRSIAVRSHR